MVDRETFSGVLLVALMAALLCMPITVRAAEPSTGSARPIEEVVVTARKREEALKDIPGTVNVLQEEMMFSRGIDSIADMSTVIPNFNFRSDLATRSRLTVRGIGTDRSGTQAPPIGVYIDGVYQNSTATLNYPLFDVERVEFLKGPQGTLYGRNAYAGVINIITKRPSNEFRMNVEAEYGSQNSRSLGASVSGPIARDRLYGLLSVAHTETDGHYEYDTSGNDIAAEEGQQVRGRLLFDATDALSFDLSATYRDYDGPAFPFGLVDTIEEDDLEDIEFTLGEPQEASLESQEGVLITRYAMDAFDIVSNTSYYENEEQSVVDGDGQPIEFLRARGSTEREIFSQELRFESTGDTRLGWLAGVSYTDESIQDFSDYLLPMFGLRLFGESEADNEVIAGFVDATYQLSDRLEIGAGLRVDHIELDIVSRDITAGTEFSDDLSLTEEQPKFTLTYDASDDVSLYVTAAKGIRQGGFNRLSLSTPFARFETDEMWNYEVGAKAVFPELAASAELSFFYIDADPLSLETLVPTDAGSIGNGVVTAGTGRSYGAEFTGNIALNDYIQFDGNLGLLDCEYRDLSETTPVSGLVEGDQCVDSSKWSTEVSAIGNFPMRNGATIVAAVTVSAKGDTRVGIDPMLQDSLQIQDTYALLSARVGVEFDNWTLLAFGTNLTNEVYALDSWPAQRLADLGVPATDNIAIIGDERAYGLRLRWTP